MRISDWSSDVCSSDLHSAILIEKTVENQPLAGHSRTLPERSLVPRRGLEPPRPCDRQHLKLVRLPIPPSGHGVGAGASRWGASFFTRARRRRPTFAALRPHARLVGIKCVLKFLN